MPEPEPVDLELTDVRLPADLGVPADAVGMVVFAHGSGSSRRSPRNRRVAATLREADLGTLLFDLLTEDEGRDRRRVFDIDLLGRRLAEVVGGGHLPEDLPVGLFGSSTGAAAALNAVRERPGEVGAVVSRGGRVDMARDPAGVGAPVRLIVGGADHRVLELNREVAAVLTAEHDLQVVEGAGHLFEGPGQLDEVARLARDWFLRHLG